MKCNVVSFTIISVWKVLGALMEVQYVKYVKIINCSVTFLPQEGSSRTAVQNPDLLDEPGALSGVNIVIMKD